MKLLDSIIMVFITFFSSLGSNVEKVFSSYRKKQKSKKRFEKGKWNLEGNGKRRKNTVQTNNNSLEAVMLLT